jgi:hypothetical protein
MNKIIILIIIIIIIIFIIIYNLLISYKTIDNFKNDIYVKYYIDNLPILKEKIQKLNINIPIYNKYETVLIEFREAPHIEFVLINTIIKLPTWAHTVICGLDNYNSIKKMCDMISPNIRIIKLELNNININMYNKLLFSLYLWNLFTSEKVLIYQEDSIIFKSNINDFIQYDYIGAPWNHAKNNNNFNTYPGGNGGFSLRTIDTMKAVINNHPPFDNNRNIYDILNDNTIIIPGNEDGYYYDIIMNHNMGKLANLDVSKSFSIETIYYDDSFGAHCFFYTMSESEWKDKINKLILS